MNYMLIAELPFIPIVFLLTFLFMKYLSPKFSIKEKDKSHLLFSLILVIVLIVSNLILVFIYSLMSQLSMIYTAISILFYFSVSLITVKKFYDVNLSSAIKLALLLNVLLIVISYLYSITIFTKILLYTTK